MVADCRLLLGSLSVAQYPDATLVAVATAVAVALGAGPMLNTSVTLDGVGDVSETIIVLQEIVVTVDAATI